MPNVSDNVADKEAQMTIRTAQSAAKKLENLAKSLFRTLKKLSNPEKVLDDKMQTAKKDCIDIIDEMKANNFLNKEDAELLKKNVEDMSKYTDLANGADGVTCIDTLRDTLSKADEGMRKLYKQTPEFDFSSDSKALVDFSNDLNKYMDIRRIERGKGKGLLDENKVNNMFDKDLLAKVKERGKMTKLSLNTKSVGRFAKAEKKALGKAGKSVTKMAKQTAKTAIKKGTRAAADGIQKGFDLLAQAFNKTFVAIPYVGAAISKTLDGVEKTGSNATKTARKVGEKVADGAEKMVETAANGAKEIGSKAVEAANEDR